MLTNRRGFIASVIGAVGTRRVMPSHDIPVARITAKINKMLSAMRAHGLIENQYFTEKVRMADLLWATPSRRVDISGCKRLAAKYLNETGLSWR